MSDKPWRGIFVIVVTPFTAGYELDEESLRKEVRFCIEAGAEGLVGPANASEFPTLSDDERKRWLEIVISEAKGQIPVVAATTCGHYLPAVALSRWAQAAGADPIRWRPLGERLGEAYQIADDIRDVLADPAVLGKPVGQDASHGRPSAAHQLGLTGAIQYFEGLVAGALAAIPECAGAPALRALVRMESERLVPKAWCEDAARRVAA
jgi:hypothetical protein